MRWLCFFCLAVFSINSLPAFSRASKEIHRIPSDAIGVKTFSYRDELRDRPVIVEFWFPTEDRYITADEDSLWVHPKEVRGAEISSKGRKLPLILMSHGNGGDRRDRSWLAEKLVKGGFAVASIDHHGNTWQTLDTIATLKFWERPKDVSFAIDSLLKEPSLQGSIDPDRIGFVGYSLGGMTGLALAGAVADELDSAVEGLKEKYPELTQEVLSQVDLRPGKKTYFDSRIKALLLLAPATYFYARPQALKSLKRPIALVATVSDEVLPFNEHFEPMISLSIPARLKVLKNGASHFIFLNRVSERGRLMLKDPVHQDAPGVSRRDVHREVGLFAVDFFQQYLR